MSGGIDAELRAQIDAEASEHLQAIETALSGDADALPAPAVDTLFRSFHSLKGLARIAAEPGMEQLAHAAEDLLGAVRSGARHFDAAVQDVLLAARDALAGAVASLGRGSPPDPALLNALRAATSARGAAAPVAAIGPWRALHDDFDLLAGLAELFEELLPEMAAQSAAEPAMVPAEDAAVLAHAARRVGLDGLEAAAALPGPDHPAAFARLLDAAERLERLTGRPCGVAAARAAFPAPAAPNPPAQATTAQAALDRLLILGVDPAPFERTPPDIEAALLRLIEGASLFELHATPPQEGGPAWAAALVGATDQVLARSVGGVLQALIVATEEARLREAVVAVAPDARLVRLDGIVRSTFAASADPEGEAASGMQVRVPVDVLDRLFGRIGEFFGIGSRLNAAVFDSGVIDLLRRLTEHAVTREPALMPAVERLTRHQQEVTAIEADIHRLISLIHESTLGLRVIPIDTLFGRFPRIVRDAAQEAGKSVRLEVAAGSIKIDKGMSDMLADPLMHMLRNAVDHGIERPEQREAAGKPARATLRLAAEQSGNRVVVEIADDGRGIDLARVRGRAIAAGLTTEADSLHLTDDQVARFIFAPGFSTAEQVGALSGRGVGMDVVLVNVTRLGGRIEIDTRAGLGTTFRLDLPLSAAIQPMLLAETAVQAVAFPERMVAETLIMPAAELQHVNGQRAMLLHGHFLPLFDLSDLLRLPRAGEAAAGQIPVVVCAWAGRRIGIEVHRVLRRHEMLIRETHPRVAALPGIGGVTTLGADRIVLVVDPDELMDLASRSGRSTLHPRPGLAA